MKSLLRFHSKWDLNHWVRLPSERNLPQLQTGRSRAVCSTPTSRIIIQSVHLHPHHHPHTNSESGGPPQRFGDFGTSAAAFRNYRKVGFRWIYFHVRFPAIDPRIHIHTTTLVLYWLQTFATFFCFLRYQKQYLLCKQLSYYVGNPAHLDVPRFPGSSCLLIKFPSNQINPCLHKYTCTGMWWKFHTAADAAVYISSRLGEFKKTTQSPMKSNRWQEKHPRNFFFCLLEHLIFIFFRDFFFDSSH